ncbi:hypothetical protein MY11210_004339 [Beauveria gryllotalpidicola]
MAADKKVMLALAGAGAIGVVLYSTRSTTRPAAVQSSTTLPPDNKARDKRDMGLSGAGIGGTAAAGGNERAIDPSQDRTVQTTAPRDKLPAGGVGGGVGAGGMSARAVELPTPKSSSSIGERPSSEPKSRSDLPVNSQNPYLSEAETGGKQKIYTKIFK